MSSRRRLAAILVASCALACGHGAPAPGQPGASDYYRRALADEPQGEQAVEYRDALEASEFEDAKKKGDILALRTFLSEFPDGRNQREARTLLEALRWNEAAAQNTELAFQGFLADEPRGAHAQEAWARIAAMQLDAAEKSGDASGLRAWLEAHPTSADRERAERALEQADFRDAKAAPLAKRQQRFLAYLAAYPSGPHRAEVDALERRAAIDEAALLEDRARLSSWARSGDARAKELLGRLALEQAAARLDAAALSAVAAEQGPEGVRAKELLAQLKKLGPRATPLVEAARALYLPRPHDDSLELPSGPSERAQALRELALTYDGEQLPKLLAELGSSKSYVALTALDAALVLLLGLPPEEMELRASRAEAALLPIAQDGPHLAALALVRLAQRDTEGALAAARAGAARDPRSLVAQLVAARVESLWGGDPATARAAAKALNAAAEASLAARDEPAIDAAAPEAENPPAEPDSAPTVWALCATEQAARAAAALLDAQLVLGNVSRRLGAAEREAHKEGACAAEWPLLSAAVARAAQGRERAAQALAGAPALAAEALARAARRDPARAKGGPCDGCAPGPSPLARLSSARDAAAPPTAGADTMPP